MKGAQNLDAELSGAITCQHQSAQQLSVTQWTV